MTINEFISKNRLLIDQTILSQSPQQWGFEGIDDEEREMWVLNDEVLYKKALNAGVDI